MSRRRRIQFLTTLSDPDITLASGMSVMRKVGGAMGKLQILADQTTLDVVMTYMNAIPGKLCRILVEPQPPGRARTKPRSRPSREQVPADDLLRTVVIC
jgi:hypothetical protein